MDLQLTAEQDLLVSMVRRFVREEIVPLELELDPDADEPRSGRSTPGWSGLTRAMGLYGLDIPPEYGGPEVDLVTHVLLAIEMSQHRAGLYAPCYGVFGGAGLAQLFEATDDQKERYLYPILRGEKRGFFGLTEASGGSDPARAIRTRAVRDGDDWIINGTKMFISGAAQGRLRPGVRPHRPGQGARRHHLLSSSIPTCPGFHVRRIVHTLRAARYATELSFDGPARAASQRARRSQRRLRHRQRPAVPTAHPLRRRLHRASPSRPTRWRSSTSRSARPSVRRWRRARRSSGCWSTTRSTSAKPAG